MPAQLSKESFWTPTYASLPERFENVGNVIIDQSTLMLGMSALGYQDITLGGGGTIAFDSREPVGAKNSFFSGK